jgi:hypothetical protein
MFKAYKLNNSDGTVENIGKENILLNHRMIRQHQEQGPNFRITDYQMFPWSYTNKLDKKMRFQSKKAKQRPNKAQMRNLLANSPVWGWRKSGSVTRLGFKDLALNLFP